MSLKFQSYNEVRDQIESGDLYFTASNTLNGKLTRTISRANISHVGIFLKDPDGRIKMLEVQVGKDIAEVYASKSLKNTKFVFLSTKKIRHEKGITDEMVRNHFERYVGEKYDILGMLVSLIWDIDNDSVYCSETVRDFFSIDASHLRRGMTPADIYTAIHN